MTIAPPSTAAPSKPIAMRRMRRLIGRAATSAVRARAAWAVSALGTAAMAGGEHAVSTLASGAGSVRPSGAGRTASPEVRGSAASSSRPASLTLEPAAGSIDDGGAVLATGPGGGSTGDGSLLGVATGIVGTGVTGTIGVATGVGCGDRVTVDARYAPVLGSPWRSTAVRAVADPIGWVPDAIALACGTAPADAAERAGSGSRIPRSGSADMSSTSFAMDDRPAPGADGRDRVTPGSS